MHSRGPPAAAAYRGTQPAWRTLRRTCELVGALLQRSRLCHSLPVQLCQHAWAAPSFARIATSNRRLRRLDPSSQSCRPAAVTLFSRSAVARASEASTGVASKQAHGTDALMVSTGLVGCKPRILVGYLTEATPTSIAPRILDPEGWLRSPFIKCQKPPPTAPMAKAPPMSSRILSGHGSRPCSICGCCCCAIVQLILEWMCWQIGLSG